MQQDYVHGYSSREASRLKDQATTLTDLLHGDTVFPPDSTVLEVGCGVGAQTIMLARNSPKAQITSIDICQDSLEVARQRVTSEGLFNVSFQRADLFQLPYESVSFDHVFVCFVLEHLSQPVEALLALKKILKSGGSITVIEGDHGSAYFHPDSSDARFVIRCLVEIQARMGGNSLIGRRLYPLLKEAGFGTVRISPRMVYVDSSRPHLIEGFIKNTFTAMVEGVREQALRQGLIDERTWEKGIQDLYRTTRNDGTFMYTFFKGVAMR